MTNKQNSIIGASRLSTYAISAGGAMSRGLAWVGGKLVDVYSTVSSSEGAAGVFGEGLAEGAPGGCLPMLGLIGVIVAVVLFVVVAIGLLWLLGPKSAPTAERVSAPAVSNADSNDKEDSNKDESGALDFKERLRQQRLRAIGNGIGPGAYQQLLAEQRREYADRGLNPCDYPQAFPAEACAGASSNEKPQANTPPVPPVSTPANPPPPIFGPGGEIKIGRRAYQHVLDGHTAGGAESQGNSIFNQGENITDLIKESENTQPTKQSFGNNYERIVDAGRPIGIDRVTGQPTSMYTVITDGQGNLVTAFPGTP